MDSGRDDHSSKLDDSDNDPNYDRLADAQASTSRGRPRSGCSSSSDSDSEVLDIGEDQSRVGNRVVK